MAGSLRITANLPQSVSGMGESLDDDVTPSFSFSSSLPNGTSVPAVLANSVTYTLSTGTAFIDLNALPIANGATATGVGYKLQGLCVKNPSGNADLVLSYGTSSPYNLSGTSFSASVEGGGCLALFQNDGAADVSTSAKNILATGTGTQSFTAFVVLG